MSQTVIFTELKALLEGIREIKRVGLWNNQFEKEAMEEGMLRPSVFIQFTSSEFQNVSGQMGVQMYTLMITLHIGFDNYSDDQALKILALKQRIYAIVHRFTPTTIDTVGGFTRSDERQNFDHDALQVYEMDFTCVNVWDYDGDTRPTKDQTLTNTPISATFVTDITN